MEKTITNRQQSNFDTFCPTFVSYAITKLKNLMYIFVEIKKVEQKVSSFTLFVVVLSVVTDFPTTRCGFYFFDEF